MLFIYLFIIAYTLSYLFLTYIWQYFFKAKNAKLHHPKTSSALIIILFGALSFLIVKIIPDTELANRFQHAIAGAFLGMMFSYLSFKDSKVSLDKLSLFILSAFLVSFLGVLNEIFEFLMQISTNLTFADSDYDTWLDLSSNLFGIILGSVFILFDEKIPFKIKKE